MAFSRFQHGVTDSPVGELLLAVTPRGLAYVAFQELATRISHRNTGRYSSDPVADRIMARARHAMVNLDPSVNPYVHWLITGTHADDLPCALRPENFDRIRDNLDRLEWHRVSVEEFLAQAGPSSFDRYNFSDLFEYVSLDHYHRMLEQIVRVSRPGARAPRSETPSPSPPPSRLGHRSEHGGPWPPRPP